MPDLKSSPEQECEVRSSKATAQQDPAVRFDNKWGTCHLELEVDELAPSPPSQQYNGENRKVIETPAAPNRSSGDSGHQRAAPLEDLYYYHYNQTKHSPQEKSLRFGAAGG